MKNSKLVALLMIVLVAGSWCSVTGVLDTSSGENVEELVAQANAYIEQGIYFDANELYQRAVNAEPDNYELWLEYGETSLQIKKARDAIDAWTKACELKPDRTEAYEKLVAYYLSRNDFEEAQNVLDKNKELKYSKLLKKQSNTIRQQYKGTSVIFTEAGNWNDGYAAVLGENGMCLTGGCDGVLLQDGYAEMSGYDAESGFISVKTEEEGWQCIDLNSYKRRVPGITCSWMGTVGDGMIPVCNVDGKYAYLDTDMKAVTKFVYDDVTSFKNGIAAVCKKGKWALVNTSFKELTDYIYDQVAKDSNGICSRQGVVLASRKGQYVLLDKKGREVAKKLGKEAKPFYDHGWAAVFQNGSWKYIDTKGKVQLETKCRLADSFSNGLAAVSDEAQGTDWYYIDETGARWMDASFAWAGSMNENGEMLVKEKDVFTVIGLYQRP